MPLTHTIGRLTITALEDASGPFFSPRAEAFPDATAAQWASADLADPAAATAEGEWWLRFRAYAIRRHDGPVTLVDAGIGPADSLAADWAPVPGRLPDELAATCSCTRSSCCTPAWPTPATWIPRSPEPPAAAS